MNWQVSGASLFSETVAARSSCSSLNARMDDGRRCAILGQQREGFRFRYAFMLRRVVPVHRIDDVPIHARNRLAGHERAREMNFNRIDAGDVVYHHTDLPSIFGKTRLPFRVGEFGRECRERICAGLQAGCKGLRSLCWLARGRKPPWLVRNIQSSFCLSPFIDKTRYTQTVTRRKVAGMEVPPLALWFWAFASSTSWRCSSSPLPLF